MNRSGGGRVNALGSTSFAANCHHCQARLRVRVEDLGQERTCPRCHRRFRLPSLEEANRLQRIQHAKAEYSFRCRLCGTLIYAHPSQQGEPIPCPDCHTPNTVPLPPPSAPAPAAPIEDADPYRLQDEDATPTTDAEAKLLRVRCSTCDALMYARTDQIGKLIPCVDCGTAVRVLPPPPTPRRTISQTEVAIEIEPPADRAAEVESHEKTWDSAAQWAEAHRAKLPRPPKRPFLDGTFTFPFYPEILPRWLGLTALWLPIVPFCNLADEAQKLEMVILIPLFILLVPVLGVLIFFVASMLMAVASRTAMGYDRIDEWPRMDFFERILNLMFPTSAFILVTAPWALLEFAAIPRWIVFIVQAVSAFGLFPVVFLSLCENNSPAVPYHRAIWRTVRQQSQLWIRFYLAALPAWAPLVAWIGLAWFWPNPWIVAMTFTVWLVTTLTYFRLLGRLAYQLSRHLPEEASEGSDDEA